MLYTRFYRIPPEKVDRLRDWFAEASRRADEVRATLVREQVSHEQALLIRTADGPLLVYTVECADYAAAAKAFQDSDLPIDIEHRAVMADVIEGSIEAQLLFNISA